MFDFFSKGWQRSVRLTDAHLFPLAAGSRPAHVLGGVRHPDLPAAFHQRRADRGGRQGTVFAHLDAQPAPAQRLEGKGLYAGPFFHHFGHCIAESAHRLWAWQTGNSDFDYVAVLPEPVKSNPKATSPQQLVSFQREILAYMGVPEDRIAVIHEPVVAADLTVPLQASVLGARSHRPQSYVDFWTDHEARFFSDYKDPLPPAAEKIYVSRSNFLSVGSFAGERYLESQLAADGFLIVRPESLRLVEQLHYYRHARLLLFAEGSALHATELLGAMKGDIVCLLRGKETAKLWQSVLHGRSHQMAFFDMITPLPPLEAARSGEAAARKAMCLIDSKALVQYLRQAGYAQLPGFDHDRFQLMEAADIARYIMNVRMDHTFRNDLTTAYLSAFRDAVAAAGNPYLQDTI